MPTVSLWLLFIYVEASVRLKDVSAVQRAVFPFTLDLCRPFAAHCIGYPVVTLGFGIKSYLGGWRLQRRQREVARENEIYGRLLTEALPAVWLGPGTKAPHADADHLQLTSAGMCLHCCHFLDDFLSVRRGKKGSTQTYI